MADKEIAALSGARLRDTRFVYIAALFAALGGLLFGYGFNVSLICDRFGGVVAFRLLFRSGNKGALFGTDRSILEGKASCAQCRVGIT